MIWLDLETRSQSDVTECGVYRLAEDPTLRIISIHYAFDDGPPRHWRGLYANAAAPDFPECADIPPFDLWQRIRDGEPIAIWNAQFDRHVWNAVARRTPTMPRIQVAQCRCIATLARAHNLPSKLKSASTWLPLDQRKLVNTNFYDLWRAATPLTAAHGAQYRAMLEYGDRDVVAMRALANIMLDFSPELLRDYQVSEAINDRGIGVDLRWCERAVQLKATVEAEVRRDLEALTGGEVRSARQPAALRDWVMRELDRHGVATEPSQFERTQKKIRADRTGYFSEIRKSFNKEVRRKLRAWMEERGVDIPSIVRLLDLVDEGSGAAWSKYGAALDRTSADGVLRGMYILDGAAQTGRYASVGLQTHNLVRKAMPEPSELMEAIHFAPLEAVPGLCAPLSVSDTLGRLLRPTLVPRKAGRVLVWGDWSAIEARVCPWLSGSAEAEPLLQMFRDGEDVYLAAASDIVGHPVVKGDPARQLGKVAVLSLGFGGGVGAFTSMARNYGIEGQPVVEVQDIVRNWRASNPWAQEWWGKLDAAAFGALQHPGTVVHAGRVSFAYLGALLAGTLVMWLPCGRPLFYPAAEVRMGRRFEDDMPRKVLTFVHAAFGRVPLWYGQLAENATQGTAASLLRRALAALEDSRWPGEVVGHTHDEIIVECGEWAALEAAEVLQAVMRDVPDWAPGLPLDAEVSAGFAYYEPAPELLEAS